MLWSVFRSLIVAVLSDSLLVTRLVNRVSMVVVFAGLRIV